MSPIYIEISMCFYVFSCFPEVSLVSSCFSMFFLPVFPCFSTFPPVFPCFSIFFLGIYCSHYFKQLDNIYSKKKTWLNYLCEIPTSAVHRLNWDSLCFEPAVAINIVTTVHLSIILWPGTFWVLRCPLNGG